MDKVLIVDDDKVICRVLQQLISWEEISCLPPIVAHDGISALEILKKDKPDIIISDLRMPNMTGSEFCEEVYKLYSDVDMVFFSAYEDFTAAQVAIRNGVADYIMKPINSESLENIKNVIRSIQQRRQQKAYAGICSENFSKRAELLQRLNMGDTRYFAGFFEDLSTLFANKVADAQNIAVSLFQILSEFQHDGKNTALLREQLAHRTDKVRQLQTAEAVSNFVKDYYFRAISDSSHQQAGNASALVARIKDIVSKRYSEPGLSVEAIAREVGFSEDYLGKLFANNEGNSIYSYILDYRINKAVQLLVHSRLSVAEITKQVGYVYPNYFSKAFRNRLGMTPTEYRHKFYEDG